jgi:hypothetical protein
MQTTGVRSHLELVPRTCERARTDVLRSRRTVGETERRLAEALEIVLTLEEDPALKADRAGLLGSAAGRRDPSPSLARLLLESLLSEERR